MGNDSKASQLSNYESTVFRVTYVKLLMVKMILNLELLLSFYHAYTED